MAEGKIIRQLRLTLLLWAALIYSAFRHTLCNHSLFSSFSNLGRVWKLRLIIPPLFQVDIVSLLLEIVLHILSHGLFEHDG